MRILLLDDDQDSRHTAAQFLQDLGHEVVQCAEAQEALGKWEQADFPLVLADISGGNCTESRRPDSPAQRHKQRHCPTDLPRRRLSLRQLQQEDQPARPLSHHRR